MGLWVRIPFYCKDKRQKARKIERKKQIFVRISTKREKENFKNPGEVEIFCTRPDCLCGSPILLYAGYRVSF